MLLGDKMIGLQTPNPAALHLSLAARLRDSAKKFISEHLDVENSKESATEIYVFPDTLETESFDCLENLFGCVVFSFTAIEAFSNSAIPDEYIYRRERQDGRNTEEYNKEQIDRYIHLDVKLGEILPELLKIDSPKGGKKWQQYAWLRDARNRLIHLKTSDLRTSDLWSFLLDPEVLNAPDIAKNLLLEYDPRESHRWLVNCPF